MRIASVVAAILLLAGPAYADPHKADPQDAQAQHRSAPVVLASADTPHATPNDVTQSAATPAKPRVGRVTHCRCGDPQPDMQGPNH